MHASRPGRAAARTLRTLDLVLRGRRRGGVATLGAATSAGSDF